MAADLIRSQIELYKSIGLRTRRRRRIARPRPLKLVQLEYFNEINKLIVEAKRVLEPLLGELPFLVESSLADRRLDAGEGRRVRELMRTARESFGRSVAPTRIEEIAERYANRTSQAQHRVLARQTKAAFGVDIFIPDTGLSTLVDGFVSENVSYITSIPERMFSDVESTINRGFRSGTPTRALEKEIAERFGVARRRAQLIARDQIASLNGQVHRARQTNLGITRYIWRTVGDERVREEHENREGEIFEWANPPSGGHPGEPINCRCSPEPVLDDVLA